MGTIPMGAVADPLEHHLLVEPRLLLNGVKVPLGMLIGKLFGVDSPAICALVDNKWGKNHPRRCHCKRDGAAMAVICALAHVDGSTSTNIDS